MLHATGRVLTDDEKAFEPTDNILTTVYKSVVNFVTDEVTDTDIALHIGDEVHHSRTDHEGYFTFHIEGVEPPQIIDGYQAIRYTVDGSTAVDRLRLYAQPSQDSLVIVTDIDDTILHTQVRSPLKWKMIANTFLRNPYRRQQVAGSSDFLTAIQQATAGERPIFYLSNSPYNLYTYIYDYLRHHRYPAGPLLLRDIGRQNLRRRDFRDKNKYIQLTHLMRAFGEAQFVFIGDSAEMDATYYHTIAEEHSGRVRAIYLRAVGNDEVETDIRSLIEATAEIDIILFTDYGELTTLAMAQGLIG